MPRVHELPSPSYPVVAMPNPATWINEMANTEVREILVEFPSSTTSEAFGNREIAWLPSRNG